MDLKRDGLRDVTSVLRFRCVIGFVAGVRVPPPRFVGL
jgi:hypothetical protein